VAGTVGHQLCHAALGNRSHGAPFRALATATGLVGKMTQTIEGPLFLAIMPGIIDRIWPLSTCRATPDPRARAPPQIAQDQQSLARDRMRNEVGVSQKRKPWRRNTPVGTRRKRCGNIEQFLLREPD
jgi:hypothetical protein